MEVRNGECSRESIIQGTYGILLTVSSRIRGECVASTVYVHDRSQRDAWLVPVASHSGAGKSLEDLDAIHDAVVAEVSKFASGLESLFQSDLFKGAQS